MSHYSSDVDRNMDFSDDDDADRNAHSEAEEDNTANGNEGKGKDDENEESDKKKVEPKVKRVRNPQPKLDTGRLKEKKGVVMIEKYFEGFKFKGKGHEKTDLESVMIRLEHWANRLYPKFKFDDFLARAEVLGTKKDMQTFLTKYRKDMMDNDDVVRGEDENEDANPEADEPVDEFDLLIAEQIEKTRLQNTQPSQVNTQTNDNAIEIDEEMRAKIERNRQIALERRRQRMEQQKQNHQNPDQSQNENTQTDLSQQIEPEENNSDNQTEMEIGDP